MNPGLPLVLLGLGAIGCRASSAPSPASAATNAYLLRLGADTLAVDQSTRTGNRIEGTLVTHLPRTIVTRYVVTLDSATGRPVSVEHNSRLPDGSLVPVGNLAPVRQVRITFDRYWAVSQIHRDSIVTNRVETSNAFPFVTYAIAFFQLPVSALRASGRDSAAYAIYTQGRTTVPMPVARKAPNRFIVTIGGFPWEVTTDGAGVVQSVDGARTTQHFVATRRNSIDVTGLASRWAEQERASRPLTTLSVRDTTRAKVGPVDLWVDYGRPTLRGRKVFGPNGVLNDTIWRTGANAATQFRISEAIALGGTRVPAGTYTLWTVAVPGRYQLIVNKQTGQWGTVYDPKQDLVRVPLQARPIGQSVEQFTIAVEPMGAGGMLRLLWDKTELSVPITVP